MKRTFITCLVLLTGCALSNSDVTHAPGHPKPEPLDPSPQITHDPPKAAEVTELGRVRISQNGFGSPAKCEAKALDEARSKLGGAVFYAHSVEASMLGMNGNPVCEVVAYARTSPAAP